MTTRLGIAGLGFVGRAFAQRAIAAGASVLGADPSPAARDAARALGASLVDDVEALVGHCDAIAVCVLDDAQLGAVVDRIVAAHSPQVALALVVSAVTASPHAADDAARRIAAIGVDFVELPMSGSSVELAQGEALGLLGATDASWRRHRALIDTLAPRTMRAGEPGAGARAKLASNLVLGLNRAALAEGLAFARALGLDGEAFLALLRASPAYSRAVDTAGPRMLARDFAPRSRIVQHRKDVALMLSAARAAGASLPLSTAHAALLDRAIAMGLGDADNVAVIAALDEPEGS